MDHLEPVYGTSKAIAVSESPMETGSQDGDRRFCLEQDESMRRGTERAVSINSGGVSRGLSLRPVLTGSDVS